MDRFGAIGRDAWTLDRAVTFLNHGSYGACPRGVLEAQSGLRARIEHEPVHFFQRQLEGLLDEARAALAAFVGAPAQDLVFVPNATAGVNAVVRSLKLGPGDELLATDHGYNACSNALQFAAERAGARVRVVSIPLPLQAADEVTRAILAEVSARTRLVLIDHVTSPTALVFPVAEIVRALAERGIDTLVDGAHAPGMLDLSIRALGCAYYTGNCHKWMCAPKGAGFLYVRPDRQASVRPIAISHGANSGRRDRSRYLIEFDWTGTDDPTAYLCVPVALHLLERLLPGGWPALRARNHALILAARRELLEYLHCPPPCPEEMIGSMASFPLPRASTTTAASAEDMDSLNDLLYERCAIEVPVFPWPARPERMLRISAHAYNTLVDYDRLVEALDVLGVSGERRS